MFDPIVISILVVVLTIILGAVYMISNPKKSPKHTNDLSDSLNNKSEFSINSDGIKGDPQVDSVSENQENNTKVETEVQLKEQEEEIPAEKEEDLVNVKNEASFNEHTAPVATAAVKNDFQQSILEDNMFNTPSKKIVQEHQLEEETQVENIPLGSTATASNTTEVDIEDVRQTGTGTTTLSLDMENIENTHYTADAATPNSTTPTPSSAPNSLQRHEARVRTISPMRSPLPSSTTTTGRKTHHHTYTHAQYKKGEDSAGWIRNSSVESTLGAASPVSVTPQRHSLPKKIIPVSDEQLPLALRQGTKITEYEKGVLAERERVNNRLLETKRKNIHDVVARVLLDGDPTELSDTIDPTLLLRTNSMESTPTPLTPTTSTTTGASSSVKKKTIVKEMTSKWSAVEAGNGEYTTSSSKREHTDSTEVMSRRGSGNGESSRRGSGNGECATEAIMQNSSTST